MAGGKKKKTKPASNPARGIATTSTISKKVIEEQQASESDRDGIPNITVSKSAAAPHSAEPISSTNPTSTGTQQDLAKLSPEELEAQLEASDLEQFVEQHGAKVRKDATRQVTRLQADKRIMRGQADYLTTRDFLPDDLMQIILEMTAKDTSQASSVPAKKQTLATGEDLISKVWALRLCLLDLDYPISKVQDVLAWLVSDPPSREEAGLLWGLSEAFDWLSLHSDDDDLFQYDFERPKQITSEDQTDEEDTVAEANKPVVAAYGNSKPLTNGDAKSNLEQDDDSPVVSDLESDVDEDELLQAYLRTRTRLFGIDPDFDNPRARGKSAKGPKHGSNSKEQLHGSEERKLRSKLEKIQSDPLFDQRGAEMQWTLNKIDLVREAAERRRLRLTDSEVPREVKADHDRATQQTLDVNDQAERLGREMLEESQDDIDLLGGMFDALPGVQDGLEAVVGDPSAAVTVRDFGKWTGMNPKRVLEEACKARNSQVKITYKLVSPTTYASRHSLSIQWSKDQDVVEAPYLPTIDVVSRPRLTRLTMIQEAATDVSQSEAYIATVALFVIFAGSPKEEKAHMKLPPTFRNLWDELYQKKHQHAQGADIQTVKELRLLVDEHHRGDDDDAEEVVFNASCRQKSAAASGTSTPTPDQRSGRNGQVEVSEELMRLWQRKASTPSYQRMLGVRMSLPMYQFRSAALDAIDRHQVVIVRGETGSGKSTQLPAFILEHELSRGRQCKVYCTEPRRISAISLANRVSEEMGEGRGDVGTARSLVGYAIRLESHTSLQTRLVYATTGIVLRMLENRDGLGDITHLVIDEVHERSIDTDFLLIMLQTLLLRKPELKVILMSATVDAQKFSVYLDGAPVIDVPGRTFPVRAMFLEDAIEVTGHTNEDAATGGSDAQEDYADLDSQGKASGSSTLSAYSAATRATLASYDEYRIDYSLILKLLQRLAFDATFQQFSKAILIFLPGIAEIRQMNEMLTGFPAFQRDWRIYPLHSSFSSDDQQAAFDVPPPGVRKIVLATNIAETGITIPDVTAVIDTGKHKEMRFDEKRQMSRLILAFIARANAKQRRGRAGRVQEGICFHLFSRHRHDEMMAENQLPEMLRLSLSDLVMRVKICRLGGIEQALSRALDPPSSKNIRRAIDALIEVEALTTGEELTTLGAQLAKLPMDVQLGKLILLGSVFGCLDFALTIAATLSSKSPFVSPIGAKKQADTVRLGFKRGDSDLLTVYNAYCIWRKTCTTPGLSEYQFCTKNFLSPQNLANIEDLKGQLLSSLVDAGFVQLSPSERSALSRVRPGSRQRNFVEVPPTHCHADNDDTIVQSVVAWSFYPKIVKQEGKGWRNVANNQTLGLHPTSVNKTGVPAHVKLLSFYSIMQSSSRFTNAQETTPAPEVAMVLLAGDAVFHMYAGVIVIDGNRLRLKVRDWKVMMALKTIRAKVKTVLARILKAPNRELNGRDRMVMEVVQRMLSGQ